MQKDYGVTPDLMVPMAPQFVMPSKSKGLLGKLFE